MKTRSALFVVAFAALLGPVSAWAGDATPPSHALLLLAATDVATTTATSESERMRQRIRRLQQPPLQPTAAPYGTGYEARNRLSPERVDAIGRPERPERVDRIERIERPERVDRPDSGGGRGGR